jgi:hypothetical protein
VDDLAYEILEYYDIYAPRMLFLKTWKTNILKNVKYHGRNL